MSQSNVVQVECPTCGMPVMVQVLTTAPEMVGADASTDAPAGAKSFTPWPAKENREQIVKALGEIQESITAGFRKVFDPSLWK